MEQKLSLIALVTLFISTTFVSAQNSQNKWLVGVGTQGIDYGSVNGNLRGVPHFEGFGDSTWTFPLSKVQVAYSFNPSFVLDAGLSLGSTKYLRNIQGYEKGVTIVDSKEGFIKIGIGGRYKFANGYLLKEDFFIDPYVRLGLGYFYNNNYPRVFDKLYDSDQKRIKCLDNSHFMTLSWGIGSNFWVNDNFGFNAAMDYNFLSSVSELSYGDFLQYSLGIVFRFGKKDSDKDGIGDADDACPEVAGLEALQGCPDDDNDGVKNSEDQCSDIAGPMENKGCPWPDTDNDGILDKDDDCADVAGPEENKGCPWPDTDNDGILDKDDDCADVAGPKENKGCPWPDTDGDGVPDKDDKCVDEKGTRYNNGCPYTEKELEEKTTQINKELENLVFKSNSDELTNESMETIPSLADHMNKELQGLSFYIDGHTDSLGKASYNKMLSEKRAATIVRLLIESGIDSDRLESRGFGESKPIASNRTKMGREKNRRVEITPKN